MIFEVCVLFCQYNSPIWNQLLSVDLAILKQPTTTHVCLAYLQDSHAKDRQNLRRVKNKSIEDWRIVCKERGISKLTMGKGLTGHTRSFSAMQISRYKSFLIFINRKMQQQRNGSHTFVSYPFSFLIYAFDQRHFFFRCRLRKRPLFGHHGVLIKTVEMLHETKKSNLPIKVNSKILSRLMAGFFSYVLRETRFNPKAQNSIFSAILRKFYIS